MFYSAVRGATGLSLVMLPLSPLPSLIAGLGWGTSGAIAAAAVSTLVVALIIGPTFAIGFAMAMALPVIMIAYLMSLARYAEDGSLHDWYPIGRIVMAIALYGAALPVLLISLDGGSFSVMAPEFTRFFKQVSEQAPVGSSWRSMDANQIKALVDLWIEVMPAIISTYWTLFVAINTYLAGRIVRISGRLVRPWPDLNWLTYSPIFALALAGAIVGIVIGGSFRVIGIGAFGAISVAFFLQGLSVIHAIANKRSSTWMISATYAALLIAGAVFMPVVAVLGAAETITRLRSRIVPIPPGLPLGSI